jgi:hypothetical protein
MSQKSASHPDMIKIEDSFKILITYSLENPSLYFPMVSEKSSKEESRTVK